MVLQQYRDSVRMKEKPLNELVNRYIDDVESFYSQFSSYYIEKQNGCILEYNKNIGG